MSLYLFVQGRSWIVDRRYEYEEPIHPGRFDEPKLFLFFTAPDGEVRRSDIAENFPMDPDARLLETVWRYAEVTHGGELGEMRSRAGIVVPRLRDVVRDFWRAIRLRCPNCGGPHILKSWFTLKHRCPTCGLRFERGESEDYFFGGIYFNVALAEALFSMVLLVTMIVTWPNVPWAGVEYTLAAMMIAAPIVLYPVSRVLWLAFDLLLRPPDAEEMAWHARAKERDDRRD
jgi:uncharacterized protein (DUF983 family)